MSVPPHTGHVSALRTMISQLQREGQTADRSPLEESRWFGSREEIENRRFFKVRLLRLIDAVEHVPNTLVLCALIETAIVTPAKLAERA